MAEGEQACIRLLGEEEAEPVSRLIHRTIDLCYTDPYPPRAVRFFKDYHSPSMVAKRSEQGIVVVMARGGQLIGTGSLIGNEISGLFVEPAAQSQGHGRFVMRELEGRARAAGCSDVVLSVSLPSRQFYERLGYEIGEAAHIDVGEGQQLDFWKARKQLGSGEV